MNYKKTIELPKVFLHLAENGFVILQFKDNIVLEKEDAKEIDELIVNELVDFNPFVALIDARNISSSITHEARDFFSKDELVLEIRKAQALVVNNLHTKLLANFYMKFYTSKNLIKVFKDYTEAYKWIKNIRDKYYE